MLAAIILSLIFAPVWARRLNASLQALTDRTRAMAAGDYSASVPRGRLAEFNQLAADMEKMARAVRQRQAELERSEQRLRRSLQRVRELNIDLESRVERRTAALELANEELSQALSTLQVAKTELARTETLAALGNLVGGVAHELNTPIGNAVMAASTLNDEVAEFARMLGEGVRRSSVEAFTARVEQGTAIALRNLQRASELISSFKQVAVDQTSMQRRDFDLGELVDEILLTLQPMLRRTPFKIEREIPRDITLDSYPGSLGQVLTNLLGNAIVHGLEGRVSGTIRISARALEGKSIELEVADDGAGIDPELFDRIFEPFVTSKAGQGGTGLGLHIVWNAVTVVLGGSISVDSKPGQGTCFRIRLPRVAPQQDAAG
jgi:signal transduction histidine kinase